MKFFFRHFLLLVSMIAVILSFLFFGRKQNIYIAILLAGLLIAAISFIIILFKDNRRSKLAWTGIVVFAIVIQQLTERVLIKTSFRIFIHRNETLLNGVNMILIDKPKNFIVSPDRLAVDSILNLSQQEQQVLTDFFHRTAVRYISKNRASLFYCTYGALDIQGGVSYFYTGITPPPFSHHVTGKWYY